MPSIATRLDLRQLKDQIGPDDGPIHEASSGFCNSGRAPYLSVTNPLDTRKWLTLTYKPKTWAQRIVFARPHCVTLVLAIFDTKDPAYGSWSFLVNSKYMEHDLDFALYSNSKTRI